jgi:hypothetical protein
MVEIGKGWLEMHEHANMHSHQAKTVDIVGPKPQKKLQE